MQGFQEILTCPVGICDGIETANLLTARIIFDERDITGDVNLALFLSDLLFFVRDGLRTVAAAIMDHVFNVTEEGGVTMKPDSPVFRPVPLRIEQQVLGEQESFDALGMVSRSVGNGLVDELVIGRCIRTGKLTK